MIVETLMLPPAMSLIHMRDGFTYHTSEGDNRHGIMGDSEDRKSL